MQKLGMKPVSGVTRVTIKKSKNVSMSSSSWLCLQSFGSAVRRGSLKVVCYKRRRRLHIHTHTHGISLLFQSMEGGHQQQRRVYRRTSRQTFVCRSRVTPPFIYVYICRSCS